MWELICHQTCDWRGLPIDRSVYDTHGRAGQLVAQRDHVLGGIRFPEFWFMFIDGIGKG